jgi:hypothetical protein
MEEGLYMSNRELSRLEIFQKINHQRITQVQAAVVLSLSLRQIQRLYSNFKKQGAKALVSKKRGIRGNHRLPDIIRKRILELVTCEQYSGFGPTFMNEKLSERHNISVSVEITRQFMIQSGVWKAKKEKRPVIHQQRKRRARFGELLQIDGSPHAWFENRGEPCVLIVFIDDATGRTFGKFFESETTRAYMITMREYITRFGRPLACYSDKHGIFKINQPNCVKSECETQYGRALRELEIDLIYAHSPQAKGRVERTNGTLQDRLVKEMRLAGISSIEEANSFLQMYWDKYNERFSIEPEDKNDAHTPLLREHELERILCMKHSRVVSKNLEVQFECTVYQIVPEKAPRGLRGSRVDVLEALNGKISIEHQGKSLEFREFKTQVHNGVEIDPKEIDRFLKEKKARKVPYHHPWRQEGRARAGQNHIEVRNPYKTNLKRSI